MNNLRNTVSGLGMTNGIYRYSAKTFFIGYGDDAAEIKPTFTFDNGKLNGCWLI